MATICPTVTAEDPHGYRSQVERISGFAERIHIDFMDGLFAPNRSIGLEQAWLPDIPGLQVDFHMMYMRPDLYLEQVIMFRPKLVIIPAEAKGDFMNFADELHSEGVSVGVALLQSTAVDKIIPALDVIDHVLIFSGDLGHFGGKADLNQLSKARELRKLKPSLELGWDGGINGQNVIQLTEGGIDVLNVGGFIQKAENPQDAYDKLKAMVGKS